MVTERIIGPYNYPVAKPEFQHWLETKITYYDNLLKAKGYLFLSDVFLDLGFEESYESRLAGWTSDRWERVEMSYRPDNDDTEAVRIYFRCSNNILDYLKDEDEFNPNYYKTE